MKVFNTKNGDLPKWFINVVWEGIRCGIVIRGHVDKQNFFHAPEQAWIPNIEEVINHTFNSDDDYWGYICDKVSLKRAITKAVIADPKVRIPILIKDIEAFSNLALCTVEEKKMAKNRISCLEHALNTLTSEKK